ncbi:MAG: chromate resistance protein [Bdellovibrio sp.]|nr:MAG: chromate resistance protein [Bdellovibrio sp.]
MKWVTRERPKIDRVACPWLIRRFVDPNAEFLHVPKENVLKVAQSENAIPYDIVGVELSHDGDLCSFDAIIKKYKIRDVAVLRLAEIVRAADTDTLERSAQAPGLLAITLGLSANFPDDQKMLEIGMILYEALYTWCKSYTEERHGWNPTTTA